MGVSWFISGSRVGIQSLLTSEGKILEYYCKLIDQSHIIQLIKQTGFVWWWGASVLEFVNYSVTFNSMIVFIVRLTVFLFCHVMAISFMFWFSMEFCVLYWVQMLIWTMIMNQNSGFFVNMPNLHIFIYFSSSVFLSCLLAYSVLYAAMWIFSLSLGHCRTTGFQLW